MLSLFPSFFMLTNHKKYLLCCHVQNAMYQRGVAASDHWRDVAQARLDGIKLGAEMVAGCELDWDEITHWNEIPNNAATPAVSPSPAPSP